MTALCQRLSMAAVMLCTGAVMAPASAQSYGGNRRPFDDTPRYGQPYRAPDSYAYQDRGVPAAAYQRETWSGFYVGGHVGGGWGRSVPNGLSSEAVDLDGFVGGGHVGYNWHFGPFVAGAELDGSWAGVDGLKLYGASTAVGASLDWTASLRGRFGVAWDNFLIYGTGGIAFGGVDLSVTAPAGLSSTHEKLTGFVWGGGVEMKINPQVSVRMEALRTNFGDEVLGTSAGALSVGADVTTVRAGVSWHFN